MRAILATIIAASFLASSFVVAGCNTMEGDGKDVKAAGSAVEGEAKKDKTY